MDDVFYVWDPLLPGAMGAWRAYQTISAANGYLPNPGGTANYSNAVPYTQDSIWTGISCSLYQCAGGTVSFTENAKIINNANNMVFRGSSLPASRQFVRVQLYTCCW
ncbi:MAG: hypothetical protein V9E88_05155 [Ferruginibacter sp.]